MCRALRLEAGVVISGALNNLGTNPTTFVRGGSSGRALILIDGKRRIAEVLQAGATPEDIERLFALELVQATSSADAQTVPGLLGQR